ncbi:MAG: hypothetical protein JSW55_03040 [Chloroflexota bacterium]|nr:MAG: hypothetical protein JSW55_03040 [Chloroflexota bacterium]
MPVKKRRPAAMIDESFDDTYASAGPAVAGASARAVSIGRVIDRLCRAPGTYQITIAVPVQRRAPWQITYYRLEPMRKEMTGQ